MLFQLPEGYSLHVYDELDSTSDLIKELRLPCGSVVFAKSQKNGKGKNGSVWISSPGNLCFSMILDYFSRESLNTISHLVFIVAVSIKESLGIPGIKYKWPNDLMLDGKKFAGILVETEVNKSVIVGVGINIISSPVYATSIVDHCQQMDLNPINMLKKIVCVFEKNKKKWLGNKRGFDCIKDEWNSCAFKINEDVFFRCANSETYGVLMGIDDCGALLINSGGSVKKFYSGDLCIT